MLAVTRTQVERKRRVSVLGATGTIGLITCELLALNPDRFPNRRLDRKS